MLTIEEENYLVICLIRITKSLRQSKNCLVCFFVPDEIKYANHGKCIWILLLLLLLEIY